MVLTKTSRAANEATMPMPIFQSKPSGRMTGSIDVAQPAGKAVAQALRRLLCLSDASSELRLRLRRCLGRKRAVLRSACRLRGEILASIGRSSGYVARNHSKC